jgi:hypothetical protein
VPDIGTEFVSGYSKVVEFIESLNSSGYAAVDSCALEKFLFIARAALPGESKKDEKLKSCSSCENRNEGGFNNDEADAADVAQELSSGT